MSFTAVVVIHDSAPDLTRLLASIDLHLPRRPQVVVVDSGSSDDGADRACAWGAEIIVLDGNPGFGAASNAGVLRAEHAITLLLNPDIELLDDGLARLAALPLDRDALFAPRLLNLDGSVQRSAHPPPGTARALLPALVHPRVLPRSLREAADPWRASAERETGWAVAACLAARTSTLLRLGPFDPSAFLFFEDLDLCLRAADAGVPAILHPEIEVRHAGGHSTAPAYGGEPHAEIARRRRAVIAARRGPGAVRLDDIAQGLTFATRLATRTALRRDARRERAQLAALRAARHRPT